MIGIGLVFKAIRRYRKSLTIHGKFPDEKNRYLISIGLLKNLNQLYEAPNHFLHGPALPFC